MLSSVLLLAPVPPPFSTLPLTPSWSSFPSWFSVPTSVRKGGGILLVEARAGKQDAGYMNLFPTLVNCSADDYTLRLMILPPPGKGKSADIMRLKQKIKAHFDKVCNNAKPVIMQRPVKVLDINFGFNDQDTIANKKLRGALARTLDLEMEKLDLMKKYHVHSEKEIYAQDVKVRILKVKFLYICEKVGVFI